jgi:hypothetical protein
MAEIIPIAINCASCGAPLYNIHANYCKCDYCGGTNRIAGEKIVKVETQVTQKIKVAKRTPTLKPKLSPFWLCVFGVVGFVVLFALYRYFIQKKENNS